jgi:hypothetical protein
VTANKLLAERARQLANRAPAGSPDRRAYGCCAVVLSTTAGVTAARRALADECPHPVKAAALAALDQITDAERTAR